MKNIIPQSDFNILSEFIASVFDIPAQSISHEKSNDRKLCDARRIMAYILCRICLMSTNDAGKLIGAKNHSTVLSSMKRFDDLLNTDKTFKEKANQCISFAKANLKPIQHKCPFCNHVTHVIPKKAKKITLCGSSKFKKEFEAINRQLTLEGNVVYSLGLFGHADKIPLTTEQKENLDRVHKMKIDNSDGIFVMDVDGYMGESTRSEIEYAESTGKFVKYLSSFPDLKMICDATLFC